MKLSFIILLLCYSSFITAQSEKICGKVVDNKTKKTLQGVSIQATKYLGTLSNSKGDFAIILPNSSTEKLVLTINFIGYEKQYFICRRDTINIISLEPKVSYLKEVVVSSRAKSLIERAIKKIPVNYPENPTIITGVMRVYNVVNDSDYYYKSDAIIKIHSQSYAETGKQFVKLVQNKFILLENKHSFFYNDPRKIKWVGEYYSISDPVLKRNSYIDLNHLKDYRYFEKEKDIYEGRRVYVIEFESKLSKQIEGTIYIDTATLAFVGFEIKKYNVKELFFVPISMSKTSTIYQLINNKWYLKNSHSESKHVIKGSSLYSRDFVVISLDTINTAPFDYNEVIQRQDENIKTFKEGNVSDWVVYDSIFKAQEIANDIRKIEVPNIDTSLQKKRDNLINATLKYLRSDNIYMMVSLTKQSIDTKNSSFGSLAEYGIGINFNLRLWNNLFFQIGNSNAYGLGGVITFTNNYLLDYEFKVNKTYRPIAIMPYAGYAYTKIKKDNLNIDQSFKSWVVGVNTSIELTRKKSLFISPAYNYNYYQGGTYTGIQPTNFSINIGFIFKR